MSSAFVPLQEAEYFENEANRVERTGTHARAQAVRAQVEGSLGSRFPQALTPAPRQVRETMATGIVELDAMLGAGLPIGAITELAGPLSSGRTGVALSAVAAAMREGNLCAWVDASDAFDPESAAANGVCLERLLWVRCGVEARACAGQYRSMSQGVQQDGRRSDPAPQPQARAGQHPRDEVRGLDTAVGELLRGQDGPRRDRSIGTPGAPNRVLVQGAGVKAGHANAVSAPQAAPHAQAFRSFGPVRRDEQVSTDRQPKRGRGAAASEAGLGSTFGQKPSAPGKQAYSAASLANAYSPASKNLEGKPWARLDQALRAADLVLQAGGFRVLVLDLGSIAPEHALRIPLATWFRFRAAADANRTVLLALTQTSCARSSAGLVVHFGALQAQVTAAVANPALSPAGLQLVGKEQALLPQASRREAAILLESIRYYASALRQRFTHGPVAIEQAGLRKPPQAIWQRSVYPVCEQA